mgnify:CR=1 FL=1
MVEVKTVSGRRDIKKFVLFPLSLYKNHPCYVPDMVSSQINDLLTEGYDAYGNGKCYPYVLVSPAFSVYRRRVSAPSSSAI